MSSDQKELRRMWDALEKAQQNIVATTSIEIQESPKKPAEQKQDEPMLKHGMYGEITDNHLMIDLTKADEAHLYSRHKKKTIFETTPGLTVLVGKNGTGKSTLLTFIETFCHDNDISHLLHDNLDNDRLGQRAIYTGEYELLATMMASSEGESIVVAMSKIATSISSCIANTERDGKHQVVILLDALDSGLSINNIVAMKQYLFKPILEDAESKNIACYIIVAANSYELARDEDCIDVKHMKHKTFKTYDSYRSFVLKGLNLE